MINSAYCFINGRKMKLMFRRIIPIICFIILICFFYYSYNTKKERRIEVNEILLENKTKNVEIIKEDNISTDSIIYDETKKNSSFVIAEKLFKETLINTPKLQQNFF